MVGGAGWCPTAYGSDFEWSVHACAYLTRAVHVGLEAAAETDAILYLSYVVTNASWSSSYDARVFTRDKTMKVDVCVLLWGVCVCVCVCVQGVD